MMRIAENLFRGGGVEYTKNPGDNQTEYILLPTNLNPVYEAHGLVDYTLSFDLRSKDISNSDRIQVYSIPSPVGKYSFQPKSFSVTTEYQRFSMLIQPVRNADSEYESLISVYGTYGSNNIPAIRNIKIEIGTEPSDIWTPAHADLTPEQMAFMPPYGEYKEIKSF